MNRYNYTSDTSLYTDMICANYFSNDTGNHGQLNAMDWKEFRDTGLLPDCEHETSVPTKHGEWCPVSLSEVITSRGKPLGFYLPFHLMHNSEWVFLNIEENN